MANNVVDFNRIDRLFYGGQELKTLLMGSTVIWRAPEENTEENENLLWNRIFIRGNLAGNPDQEGDSGLAVQFITCESRSRQNSLRMMQGLDITMPYRCVGRTANGIMMWEPVCTLGFDERYTSQIACKPDDDDIWLCVMGSPSGSSSGNGIYRHTNYGAYPDPWVKVLDIPTIAAGGGSSWGLDYRHMGHRLKWSLSSPNTVFFLNSWGSHQGKTAQGQVFRSTDAGVNWSAMSTNAKINALGLVYAIAVNPTNPAILHAVSRNGHYKSTDSGANWTEMSSGLPGAAWITSVQINEMNQNHLRVFAYMTGTGASDTSGEGVYESTNGGSSWSRVNTFRGVRVDSAPWDLFDQYIVFGNNVGGSGQSRYNSASHNNAQISTVPSILGWEAADGFWPPWHGQFRAKGGEDAQAMSGVSWDPVDRDRYAGTARCTMWEAAEGNPTQVRNAGMGYAGEAWGECNLNSLYQVEGNGDAFGVSLFDYGFAYTLNKFNLWTRGSAPSPFDSTGTNIAAAFSPNLDGRVVALGGTYGPLATVYGSRNWGATWPTTVANTAASGGNFTRSCFVDWHQTNPNFVYTDKYRSSDGGETFHLYTTIDNGSNPFPGNATDSGRVIGMCRGNCDVIWALGSDDRTIYRSADRGVNWIEWFQLPNTWANLAGGNYSWHFLGFYPHPENDEGFLFYYNSRVQYVYAKDSVTALGAALNLGSTATSIRCLHADPNVIYVMKARNGEEIVYATDNNGADWIPWTDNAPRTGALRVLDVIQATGDVVYGGTCGPGMRKGIKMVGSSLLDEPTFSVYDYGQLTSGGGNTPTDPDDAEVQINLTIGNEAGVYYGYDDGSFAGVYGSFENASDSDNPTMFGGTVEMMTVQSSGRLRIQFSGGLQISGLTDIELILPNWTGAQLIATWNGSERYQTELISGLASYFTARDGQTIEIGFNDLS